MTMAAAVASIGLLGAPPPFMIEVGAARLPHAATLIARCEGHAPLFGPATVGIPDFQVSSDPALSADCFALSRDGVPVGRGRAEPGKVGGLAARVLALAVAGIAPTLRSADARAWLVRHHPEAPNAVLLLQSTLGSPGVAQVLRELAADLASRDPASLATALAEGIDRHCRSRTSRAACGRGWPRRWWRPWRTPRARWPSWGCRRTYLRPSWPPPSRRLPADWAPLSALEARLAAACAGLARPVVEASWELRALLFPALTDPALATIVGLDRLEMPLGHRFGRVATVGLPDLE